MAARAIPQKGDPAYAGQARYNQLILSVYDPLVFRFNSPILWRCHRSHMEALCDAHISARHLDVGVGSGYFLDRCRFPVESPDITLMDLNENALTKTAHRLERFEPQTLQANAVEPWPVSGPPFESVGMMNLVHCLPGSMPHKKPVFSHARSVLAPGGRLFGTTVLGEGVDDTFLSRLGLRALTRFAGFSAWNDSPEGLEACLAETFDSYEVEVRGVMGLFVGHVRAER